MFREKKTRSLLIAASMAAVMMSLFTYCVPAGQSQEEFLAVQKARRDSLRRVNHNKCEFKLSNADQYKLQENWSKAIENYRAVIDLGCAEDFWNPLYEDMALCYFKENKVDSAAWSIEEGLLYNNSDRHMLEVLAYYKHDDIAKQIEIWNHINTLYPGESETLFKLADLYATQGNFDAQIEMLDRVLAIDPANTKADQAIIKAYKDSGRDPLERYASAWENDKMNASNAYQYSKELFDRGELKTALEVLKQAATLHSGNRNIEELLAQAYEQDFQMDQALIVYQDLAAKYPADQTLVLKVVKLLTDAGQFQEALKVAEKAVVTTPANGQALAARGDIYYAAAENCSAGKNKLDFNDKLVYHMAYEDYRDAMEQGNSMVGAKLNFLKNPNNSMIISSKSDYFLASEANKVNSKTFKVIGDCYSWITRTVTVK